MEMELDGQSDDNNDSELDPDRSRMEVSDSEEAAENIDA